MADNLAREVAGGGFVAECRVEYYGGGRARKGKMTILAAPPDRLRVDALSFTDDLISVLAVADGAFAYFERGERECFHGPLCAAPFVARFPMIADPDRLLSLLEGSVPLLPETDRQDLSFSREEGVYLLTLVKGGTRQVVRVEPDGRTPTGMSLYQSGGSGGKEEEEEEEVFRISFSGRVGEGARTYPRFLRLEAPSEGGDLSIEYRSVESGVEFKSDPFHFDCPRGTILRKLDCGGESEP